jgi:hypothetical protein
MDISIFTQSWEAVLPNVSTKRIQLPRRIRSTSIATAGAATAGAGALPNGPCISGCQRMGLPQSMLEK